MSTLSLTLGSCDDVSPAAAGRAGGEARPTGRSAPLPVGETVSVRPDEPIARALGLLMRSGLSALPVVDAHNRLVGLLTESDLLVRMSSRRRSSWTTLWARNEELIRDYRKAAGTTVSDVMGPAPVPVPAGASLPSAADLLARQRLRELPVVADGRVVGMISAPSILAQAGLAGQPLGQATDPELVAEMRRRLRREPWVTNRSLCVEADRGVLFLAGLVESEEERAALDVMARTIPGCTGVDNQTFPRSALRGLLT